MADDPLFGEMLRVVRDLTTQLSDYETNSSADRADFKQTIQGELAGYKTTIEGRLVDLRKDFSKALAPVQLDNLDHRRAHDADRVERVNRQWTVNLWMAVLTLLVVVNLGLLIYIIAYTLGRLT